MQSPDGRECSQLVKDKKIKLSGKRTSTFYILNPKQRQVEKIEVDDCVITTGARCDWMIVADDTTPREELYIELKGSGVSHGVRQLEATIRTLSDDVTDTPKRSFIVFSRNPMSGTDIQRHKKNFCEILSHNFI